MEEYFKCFSYWIDKDPKYGKTSACRVCSKEFHSGKWGLMTNKDIYRIYTTDLEMPQCPPNFTEDMMNSEYFLETMIQNMQDGSWLGFQARYKTREEAIEGHWLAYDKLEDMLLHPDKYPQGIIEMFCNAIDEARETKSLYSEKTKKLST
jgi:hypothetical protein